MEYVLTTRSLSKHYGHFKAISDLSMNVPKGAIYGFVGINIHPLSGWFFIFGHSPNTTSHAHVRIYWPASHALNYLLPVNGSLGSNRLN